MRKAQDLEMMDKIKVLIADDDLVFLRLTSSLLSDAGYAVAIASSRVSKRWAAGEKLISTNRGKRNLFIIFMPGLYLLHYRLNWLNRMCGWVNKLFYFIFLMGR